MGAGTGGSDALGNGAGEGGGGTMPADECGGLCDDGNATNGRERCVRGHCIPGNAPPKIESVSPTDGQSSADPTGSIRIEFSEELDATTVSRDTVMLFDGKDLVPGTVSYSGTRVTFKPDEDLALLVTYTLALKATITDLDGVPMLADFASTFTVRDGNWDAPKVAPVGSSLDGVSADVPGGFLLGSAGEVVRYADGAWTTICETCWGPLAGNGRGVAVTATFDGNGVVTARQYRNGVWDTDGENICELTGYVPQTLINVAVAPTGEAHVALRDDFVVRTRNTDTGATWSSGSDTAEWTDVVPQFAFNRTGEGFAYWTVIGASDHALHAVHFHEGTAEVTETVPSSEASGTDFGSASIALTDDGGAMATWLFSGSLFVSHHSATGWAMARTIPGSTNVDVCTLPSLVSDGEDFVLAWGHDEGMAGTPCRVYSSRWHEGQWGNAELRSDDSISVDGNPAITTDAHGNLLLLWTVEGQLYYTRYNHGIDAWAAPAQAFASVLHDPKPSAAVSRNGTIMLAYYETDVHFVYTAMFQ